MNSAPPINSGIAVEAVLDSQSQFILATLIEAYKRYTTEQSWTEQLQSLSLHTVEFLQHLLSDNIKSAPEQTILKHFLKTARELNTNETLQQFNYQYIRFAQIFGSELLFRSLFLKQLMQLLQDQNTVKNVNTLQLIKKNEMALKQSMPSDELLQGLNMTQLTIEDIPFLLNQYPVIQWNSILRQRNLEAHFNQYFSTLTTLLAFLSELSANRRFEFFQHYWLRSKFLRLMHRGENRGTVNIKVYENIGKFFNVIRYDPLDQLFTIKEMNDLFDKLNSWAFIAIALTHVNAEDHLFFLQTKKITLKFNDSIKKYTDLKYILHQMNKQYRLSFMAMNPYLLSLFKQAVANPGTGEDSVFYIDPIYKHEPGMYAELKLFTTQGAHLEAMLKTLQAMDEAHALTLGATLIAEDKTHPDYDLSDRQLYRELLTEINKQIPQPRRNDFEKSLDGMDQKDRLAYIINNQKLLNELIAYINDFPWVFLSLIPGIPLTDLALLQRLEKAMDQAYTPPPQPQSRFQYIRAKVFPPSPPQMDYRFAVYHAPDKDFYRELKREIAVQLQRSHTFLKTAALK